MYYINKYLEVVIFGNIIFLISYWRFLFFLKKRAITPVEATERCVTSNRSLVKVHGMFMGVLEKRKGDLIRYRENSLENTLMLNPSSKTKAIVNESKRIAYGDDTIALGYVDFIDNNFVLCNIKYICINKPGLIKRAINLKYSMSMCISILLIISGEVIKYAYIQLTR